MDERHDDVAIDAELVEVRVLAAQALRGPDLVHAVARAGGVQHLSHRGPVVVVRVADDEAVDGGCVREVDGRRRLDRAHGRGSSLVNGFRQAVLPETLWKPASSYSANARL